VQSQSAGSLILPIKLTTFAVQSVFLCGEENVDSERIGIMGSSYGGGLVTWIAGNDPRVKCVVAQVPGMGNGRNPNALKLKYELATKQARGETEPIPMETGKLTGKLTRFPQMRTNQAKSIGFSVIDAAATINIPTLIVVAENDELVDNDANGGKVFELLKSKGNVPTAYHVIKGSTHFDVYNKYLPEATDLELKWYQDYLQAKAAPN
jgi:dipeptidyl aminopeptidase/acylaminoacyl peptidase